MNGFPYRVRAAQPADIAALMRLKWQLALGEDATQVVRATASDWRRGCFGTDARFIAFVAEFSDGIVGMATCSERFITGWPGSTVLLQDLFVDAAHRDRGVASALLAEVARFARERSSPLVELTVRADNRAQSLYRRLGFVSVPHCLTYVLSGPALTTLAEVPGLGPAAVTTSAVARS